MKSLTAVVLATILALAVVRWLVVVVGVQEPLAPGPEQVVQTFMAQLAERPQDALKALAPSLRLRTSALDLLRIDSALRGRYRRYSIEPGGTIVRVPRGAQYTATLLTADGHTIPSQFRLRRDPLTGLWQIASFESLTRLAAPRQPSPVQDMPISL